MQAYDGTQTRGGRLAKGREVRLFVLFPSKSFLFV